MKSFTKRIGVTVAALAIMVTMAFGIGICVNTAYAAESEDTAYKYFYSRLLDDTRAKKFYSAFEEIEKSGALKKGKLEFDVIQKGFADAADVSAYVNGTDNKIIKAFGAGRDSFIMDYPDLFYVDIFGISLSMGTQGKSYAAYLDSSQSVTLYKGNLNTEKAVNDAIAVYEAKLNEIVTAAKAAGDVKEQIKFVNNYICDNTEYSFGTEVKDGKNIDTPAAAYISTAYGSLVNGKAICGGYATGFKAVMDRLGIPCVCVQGYSKRTNGNLEPHMWNYVEIEGLWYAVDVTFNDAGSNREKVLFTGGETLQNTHLEDNIISSSNYELSYPAIKPYDYGVDTDDNGMDIIGAYKDSSDETGKILELSVSFEGKGAVKLKEEGKHFIFRTGQTDTATKEITWTPWMDSIDFGEVWVPMFANKDDSSKCILHAGIEYIQFALTALAPDENLNAFYPTDEPDKYGDLSGKPHYYAYKPETLTQDAFLGEPSAPYHNNGFGSYVPAPGAAGVYPANTGDLPVDKTYDIRIVYNTPLELADNGKLAGIDFTTSRGNDTVKQHAALTDFNWDGDKTITFKFTPSKMYIHNAVYYYFVPTNLVGVKSKKVPNHVAYVFKGKSVVCSKIFNDGRLYMNVFGQPKMLDDSDLSVSDFKDENGNYYAASQRSQLMLVASKPSAEKEKEMDETLKRDIPIKDDEIVSSSTYEIHLQICGVVQKVPNGSYMQVAFGFPEGYDANDAGTTFKIYHYTHDDKGNITGVEEIPVIITEYGLIAKVKSFSPFTIVQVKKTSAAVTQSSVKNIYAYVNGAGGTITTNGKSGIAEVTEKSVTYNITANEGYEISSVSLNGKLVDAKKYANGKLVLNASEINSDNMLEVKFITSEASKSYAEKGVSLFIGNSDYVPPPASGSAAGIVILFIAIAVILAGGGFALWWYLFKKRPAAATAAAGKTTSAAAKKPAVSTQSANKTRTAIRPAPKAKAANTIKPNDKPKK